MAAPTNRIQSIDWDRLGEYLLGRSTLIGIASLMLLVISGYATWHGMRDFIVGVSAAPTDTQGGLSVPNDVLVIRIDVNLIAGKHAKLRNHPWRGLYLSRRRGRVIISLVMLGKRHPAHRGELSQRVGNGNQGNK